MTERERKLMLFGQSVLNLIVRDNLVGYDVLDRIEDNAIDLGLARWIELEDGKHHLEFTHKPEDKQ